MPQLVKIGRLMGNAPGLGGSLPPAAEFYIRPAAHGAQTGLTWDDALSFSSAAAMVTAALSGGKVYIAAWDGSYLVDSASLVATMYRDPASGPVTVQGVLEDLTPAKATINSTRVPFVPGQSWPRTDPDHSGYDIFRIASGSKNISFSFFNFTNIGNGFLFLGNADTISITDCDAANSYILVDLERTIDGTFIPADTYATPNLTVERMTSLGCELGLFNVQSSTAGITANDLNGDALYYYGQAFCTVIHNGGTCASPTFNDLRGDDAAYNNRGPVYWNADGIGDEVGTSNAIYNDCRAEGNDDAGFDTKGENGTHNRNVSARNKKNYKHWSMVGGTHNDTVSFNPVKNGGTDNPQHFLFAGQPGSTVWDINRPVITGINGNVATVFQCEKTVGSLTLNVDDWSMTRTATTFSITGTNTLNDSGNDLGDIPFYAVIWLTGCANAANNNVPLLVTASAAGALTLTLPNGSAPGLTNESAGASITIRWGIYIDPDAVLSFSATVPLTINYTPTLPTVSGLVATWRTGMEQGVIDQATSIGDVMADLSLTSANLTGTLAYRIKADADAKFAIVGSELRLGGTLNPAVKTTHTCTVQGYDPSGVAQASTTITIYVNATVLDVSTTAFDAALIVAGLPSLNDGTRRRWRSMYDNHIRGMKAINGGAYWTTRDGERFTESYDIGVAKRNLRQNAYHDTWVGSPTWSAKNPWVGNGTDAKITIPFNASTAGGNFQQNSCCLFLNKVGTNIDETALDFGVDSNAIRSFIRARVTNTFAGAIQGSSAGSTGNTNSVGFFGFTRRLAASYRRFLNSAAGATVTHTSTGLANANMFLGSSAAVGGGFTAGGYAAWSWGGDAAGDQADFLAWQAVIAQSKAQAAISE